MVKSVLFLASLLQNSGLEHTCRSHGNAILKPQPAADPCGSSASSEKNNTQLLTRPNVYRAESWSILLKLFSVFESERCPYPRNTGNSGDASLFHRYIH